MVWGGMQNWSTLNTLTFRSKNTLSDYFFHGQTYMVITLNQNEFCHKVIKFKWIYAKDGWLVCCSVQLAQLIFMMEKH
jgi:hypothetical protein